MKKGTKYKKMTEVSYGQVKSLQNAGVKCAVVSRATGIGKGTVHRIFQSKDFTDYKENMLEYYRKYKRTTMPKNDSVVPFPEVKDRTGVTTAVTDRLDVQTEILREILKELKAKKIKLF